MCTNEKAWQIFLQHLPVPIRHVVKSFEKIMCHTSARFNVIILITRILTDTRRSNNIEKIIKFA